ncbi:hypothetical protein AHAS_Ahas02G0107300 [Arachis hypogaea]
MHLNEGDIQRPSSGHKQGDTQEVRESLYHDAVMTQLFDDKSDICAYSVATVCSEIRGYGQIQLEIRCFLMVIPVLVPTRPDMYEVHYTV